MAESFPVCRNQQCPFANTNKRVRIVKETDEDFVFGCYQCGFIHVITKPEGKRKAAMEVKFRETGKIPRWAKSRRFFT